MFSAGNIPVFEVQAVENVGADGQLVDFTSDFQPCVEVLSFSSMNNQTIAAGVTSTHPLHS